MKNCRICKEEFPVESLMVFARIGYKEKQYVYYSCRACRKKLATEYRNTEKGKIKIANNCSNSASKYPTRMIARRKLKASVKSGEIIKPIHCEKCNEIKLLDGHHEDYSKPLQVMWLCRQCNADRHKYLKANNIPLK